MTDPWQPPDTPASPRFGEFAPPGTPPVASPPPLTQGTAWTPPPKPGLIPLRPIGLGTLLGAAFQVLRRNPKATFGSGLIIQGAILLVTSIVIGLVGVWAADRISSAPADQQSAVSAGALLTGILAALVPLALSLVASALLQAVIVVEVARATLGEKLRMGALWRRAWERIWPLTLWTLLLTGALVVGLAVIVGIVVLLVTIGGDLGLVLGILVGIFGGILLLSTSAWLYTKTSLVPCLIVLERLGLRAAIGRSWSLTRGYFWRTLGVLMLVWVMVQTIAQIVTFPVSVLLGIGSVVLDPTGAFTDATSIVTVVLSLLISLPVGALAAVVQSATIALVYLDLRMRKEGLDLELARFVESAQHGGDVPDPYLWSTHNSPGARPA